MRHAKSSWKTPDISDFDRPLNDRGLQAAPFMGKWIKENDLTPGFVLCSSALRAQTTAQLVADGCGFADPISPTKGLYLTQYPDYVAEIKKVKSDADTLLLVAHNPTMEDFLGKLTYEYRMFKTATLAKIILPIDSWKKININTTGEFAGIWYVKDLQEG